MRQEVQDRLLDLNASFYRSFADAFAQSRANPQPGFAQLLPYLPRPCGRVLDVGCGEGRFGRFLMANCAEVRYVGVDLNATLLQHAEQTVGAGEFHRRDLARAGSLVDLGTFDLVVSLAVLQHLPGRENRVRLLAELRRRLSANGKLFISTWQFLDSERQRSKILPWNTVGLRETQVDAGDYLMTWQAGGYGLRYVALIDYDELERLAHAAGLEIVHSFRSDGAEGNLNLYAVLNALKRDEPPAVVGDAGVELI